ncbi:MAG: threonine/serine dehydratase [Anaerolineae bacterium]|nr:threonine/serine dehydratase [Gemmatimonadaceae bacterium]
MSLTTPIAFDDVLAARERIRPHIAPSPLRNYAALDECVGADIEVFVKHENHLPTNSFKVRNGLSFMTALDAPLRSRGVVAATRGNHGLGLAWAGKLLGVAVTIVVPLGNNPEKNIGMRGLGARLIEEGADYDESVEIAERLVRDEGLTLAHSTNHPAIIAGAATLTLELLEQQPDMDALVIAVGGGSQAVGALTVAREMRPHLQVYGVQAAGASAAHDSWHAKQPLSTAAALTFADGLATRSVYKLTFPALRDGLAGFVTVTDAEIAEALRQLLGTTHTLVEGAGAAGLAGLYKLRELLTGKRVGIIISGGNIDHATLKRVVAKEL